MARAYRRHPRHPDGLDGRPGQRRERDGHDCPECGEPLPATSDYLAGEVDSPYKATNAAGADRPTHREAQCRQCGAEFCDVEDCNQHICHGWPFPTSESRKEYDLNMANVPDPEALTSSSFEFGFSDFDNRQIRQALKKSVSDMRFDLNRSILRRLNPKGPPADTGKLRETPDPFDSRDGDTLRKALGYDTPEDAQSDQTCINCDRPLPSDSNDQCICPCGIKYEIPDSRTGWEPYRSNEGDAYPAHEASWLGRAYCDCPECAEGQSPDDSGLPPKGVPLAEYDPSAGGDTDCPTCGGYEVIEGEATCHHCGQACVPQCPDCQGTYEDGSLRPEFLHPAPDRPGPCPADADAIDQLHKRFDVVPTFIPYNASGSAREAGRYVVDLDTATIEFHMPVQGRPEDGDDQIWLVEVDMKGLNRGSSWPKTLADAMGSAEGTVREHVDQDFGGVDDE